MQATTLNQPHPFRSGLFDNPSNRKIAYIAACTVTTVALAALAGYGTAGFAALCMPDETSFIYTFYGVLNSLSIFTVGVRFMRISFTAIEQRNKRSTQDTFSISDCIQAYEKSAGLTIIYGLGRFGVTAFSLLMIPSGLPAIGVALFVGNLALWILRSRSESILSD